MFFDRLTVSLPDGEGLFSFGSLCRRQKLMSNLFIKLSTLFGFDAFVEFKFSDSWLVLDLFLSGLRYVSVLMYRDLSLLLLPLPKNGQPQKILLCEFKDIPPGFHYLSFRTASRWNSLICHRASSRPSSCSSSSSAYKCCNRVAHRKIHHDA